MHREDEEKRPVQQPTCFQTSVVVGMGETAVLERFILSVPLLDLAVAPLLPNNGIDTALSEVVVLSQGVTITDCAVCNGKILLSATLHKELLLTYRPTTFTPPPGLVVGTTDCMVRPGAVVAVSADCPFAACIPVPGACPGDACFIELACVDAVKDRLIDVTGTGTPDLFEEKVCIKLQVKAIRNQQVTI